MNNIRSVTRGQKITELPKRALPSAQEGEEGWQYPRWRPGALIRLMAGGPMIYFLLAISLMLIISIPSIFPDHSSINSGADIHNEKGIEAYDRGQYREALNHFQQGLVIIREVGNRAGEGATLNNIGVVYERQGLYEQALKYYYKALVIARDLENKPLEERILNNMKDITNKMPTKHARIRLRRSWLV